MEGKSDTLGQQWTIGKHDTLVSDGIFALGVGLLALAMAVVFVFAVLPHAELH
jgi:hypothetical protein